MVARAPEKSPVGVRPAKLPVRRVALNRIGEALSAEPHADCVETRTAGRSICPPPVASRSGDLPSRPFSTVLLSRAPSCTGPVGVLEIDRRPDRADRQPRRAELDALICR